MNYIKDLFNGDLLPLCADDSVNAEFICMKAELEHNMKKLLAMLNRDGGELLKDTIALRERMDSLTDADNFVLGFKAGARLILDAFKL